MLRAWAVILALLTVLTPPQRWGAAQAREFILWMDLPDKGQPDSVACYDTIPGPPIHELEWLRIKGWCFNPARCDTFNTSVNISGMEGDSLGIGIDLPPGAHGELRFRTVNPVGESWGAWYLVAVPL